LRGQEVPAGEVFGMAGVAVGSDGTFRDLGGGAGYRLSRRWMVTGEFHHLALKKEETQFGIPVKITGWEGELLGGVHILFPRREGKVEPFISVGGGMSHESAEGTARTWRETVRARETWTSPALFGGGGARIYISDNWGVRPEAKYMAGTGGGVLVTIGVFYRFR